MIDWVPPLIGLAAASCAAGAGVAAGHQLWKRHEREHTAFTESLKRVPLHSATHPEPRTTPRPGDVAVFHFVRDGQEITVYGTPEPSDEQVWGPAAPPEPRAPADYLTEADREWLRGKGWKET